MSGEVSSARLEPFTVLGLDKAPQIDGSIRLLAMLMQSPSDGVVADMIEYVAKEIAGLRVLRGDDSLADIDREMAGRIGSLTAMASALPDHLEAMHDQVMAWNPLLNRDQDS